MSQIINVEEEGMDKQKNNNLEDGLHDDEEWRTQKQFNAAPLDFFFEMVKLKESKENLINKK